MVKPTDYQCRSSGKDLHDGDIWQYWLLLTNKGKTTAQAVNISVERIIQNGKPINRGYPEKRDSRIAKLNDPIQSEEKVYVKLTSIGKFVLQENNIQVHTKVTQNLKNKCNTEFSLLVTGDNIQPFKTCVKYVDSEILDKSKLLKC